MNQKKLLSLALSLAMVFQMVVPVFAEETTPPGVNGVCTHHTEHTAYCGYQQGTSCTHAHTDDCYKVELTCKLIEGDAPEIATDIEATLDSGTAHTHGDSCYTKIDNCKHTHDDTCGYTPDSPCTFDPESCTQCDTEKQPEQVCTCPPVDSGELVHGENCPLYTTPALSEAVKALIALVDALPNADTITDENRDNVSPAFDAAQTAYEALSGDDKAAFVTTKQYAKLWALYTALYPFVLMANEATWDMKDGDFTLDNTCSQDCTHTVTGTSTGGKIIVTGGTHNVTLDNVTIDVSATANACAFEITGGATVNLTLTGANTLKSGKGCAGLQVSGENTLAITNSSIGSLISTGGENGAGIGGGNYGAGGTINIGGGTISAIGDRWGAGIGGGYSGVGGTITISDHAVVFATKGSSALNHIGGGLNGALGTVNRNGGIIFEGTSGLQYGTNVTPTSSFTIPSSHILTIKSGKELTINSDITVTNNGTIVNVGSISGTITGNQPISPNPATYNISIGSLMLDSTCGGGTCTGHTVNGNTTTYKIIVESGTHNVILDGVEIDVSATESACAFEIANGATVNLMLTGTNTLKSGKRRAGLEVSNGNTLTITEASTGSLGATGGLYGAGIGGGYDAGGTININGGIVTATGGQWGAGIGGGTDGAGGTIIINGGTVTATGGAAAGIDIGTITIEGNAVVFAKSGSSDSNHISADGGGTVNKTSGIVFEGNAGVVCGTSVTLSDDFTIPTGYTLTIVSDQTLDVSGITATNNGTIVSSGTIIGKFKGKQPVPPGANVEPVTLDISGADNYVKITSTGYKQGTADEIPHIGDYIITGTATSSNASAHIFVSGNIFNITLKDASIQPSGKSAFVLRGGSTVNLTLEGTNVLSGNDSGLHVPVYNALTITEASTGSLRATSNGGGAGIGGASGTVIEGGTVTIDGNTVVFANSSSGGHISGDTVTKTSGIIFEGTAGSLYAANVTPSDSFTVPIAYTLSIEAGKTLTVSSGKTLTNNGTINNLGTVQNDGTLINKGTLSGKGSLTGDGVVQTTLTESMISLNQDSYVYTGRAFEPSVTVASIPWTGAVPFVKDTDYTVAYADNTAASTAAKITVTPQGSKLTGSAVDKTFTITTANSALELITNKTDNAFTYGETITFTANVSIPTTKARAASANTIDFYCGDTKLNDSPIPLNESGGTGTATFTYNTTSKKIPAGEDIEITAEYGGSGNLNGVTQTVNVTLDKKVLTGGTITTGQSKPYDGNNSFSGIAATFVADNGVLGSDAVNATVGGTTSSSAAGTSLPLTVTSATLGAADAGFYLPPTNLTTITGNVAITKAPLTVSGGTVTPKQYDGTTTATVTNLIFNGLKNSESLSIGTDYIVGSPTYNDASVGTGKTVTGTASLTTSARANNYSLTGTYSITGDINKAASTLTITGDPAKPYDGAAVSEPATTQTGSTGAVTFQWYSGSTKLASAPKNAGSYTVKAILAPNATHEGVTATRDFVISKTALAITGYTAENKNYDGKRDATVSAVAFSGLQNGESLTSGTDYTTAASFADQNANSGISVAGTVTLTTTATASNYSLASNTLSGQTANIAAINPTYSVANQKITLNKTLAAIQASGAATGVNGESVAGTLTWAESSGGNALTNSYAFTGNAGDTKTLYWTFAPTSGNYKTLSGSTVFTLTNKKVPVLTVSNIVEIYNGKAITTVNGTAKEDGTTVAGTFAFDGAPTMKDADVYNVTVKFTPNDTESYEIATTSITVTINKATVGIALNLSKDRITAGEPLPTPSIAYSGLVSGESLTPATEPIFAGMPSGSTEGTYTITWSNKAAMQAEIEALHAYQNYTANYKDSVTLTIEKKSGGGGGTGGGGGGGSTGGSDNPTPPSENKPDMKPPVTEGTNAKINSDKDGNATAKADDKEIAKAIEKAQKADKGNGIAITPNVKTMDDTKSLSVTLSAATMTALTNAKVAQFTINNGLTTITLDLTALNALKGGDVILSVSKVDVKTLSAEAQNAIAGRPVFRFGATVGGKAVTDFRGGRVGLQMPYWC